MTGSGAAKDAENEGDKHGEEEGDRQDKTAELLHGDGGAAFLLQCELRETVTTCLHTYNSI